MKVPRLFISHAWDYNSQYYRLIEMLDERPYFNYFNHSVPEHDPIDFKKVSELESQLRTQIATSQVVIVLGGMYGAYRNWMIKEIEIAVEYGKPIIAVLPWGQINSPKIVTDNATEIVGWNTNSVVNAIRKYV
jgi:MTH538 TIR-like domain (DUF1863)